MNKEKKLLSIHTYKLYFFHIYINKKAIRQKFHSFSSYFSHNVFHIDIIISRKLIKKSRKSVIKTPEKCFSLSGSSVVRISFIFIIWQKGAFTRVKKIVIMLTKQIK